ncbi:hypothetical protein [Natrinema soli]|uniref:Uncharacterized protein n=1 Tax=Natrinema soli TaxID=1930624 RepID=A0ABD5T159_9EURY|nr:hypothetical protein [Natrinema soli]
MTEPALEVTLPNVGPGPDPLALAGLIAPVAPADPTTAEEQVTRRDRVRRGRSRGRRPRDRRGPPQSDHTRAIRNRRVVGHAHRRS